MDLCTQKNIIKISVLVMLFALLTSCARNPETASSSAISLPSKPNTSNRNALAIYEKLPVYAEAAKLPWTPITDPQTQHAEIRTRLIAFGDLSSEHESLSEGIKAFQSEHDLSRTGKMDQRTLAALNVTPQQRFYEMVESMHQWAKYPEDENSRYVLVNIPSYNMHLVNDGGHALDMKVIIGRPSRPTPTLRSTITTVVFNPTWNVPETILGQDVIPGMRKNPNYMKEHYDMRVYKNWDKDAPEISTNSIDWQTATANNFAYRVTAPPSDKNPLGRFKFIFNNEHDVYMHDTPEKSLFALSDRARSSGCVRLENALELVRYFYADNNDLNEELVQQYLSTYDTKYIDLRHPMPIYITYILVSVDDNGRLHFWKDVYGG